MTDSQLTTTIPTAEDLHDAIMGAIEPDLLTSNIHTLDEKYAGESEEEKALRMERYKKAFTKYNEVYEKWISSLHSQVSEYKAGIVEKAVVQSNAEDDALADDIASKFDQLD